MHDILHIMEGPAILDESMSIYYNKTSNDYPKIT